MSKQALRAVPGVTEASVNLASERAVVQGSADIDTLIAAVAETGKTARPVASGDTSLEESSARRDEEARQLRRRVFRRRGPDLAGVFCWRWAAI